MGLEKDLEKAKKERYWVSITTKSQNNTYGKVREIEGNIVRLCPYHYISTPFSFMGEQELYFEKIKDKDISICINDISFIVPMPDEIIKKIEEKADEIIGSREKKAGFKS